MYSQAIAGDAGDASLFANRSAAHVALGLFEAALWDARQAAALRPEWAKAHYRLGCAFIALSQWAEAAAALARCLELEPGAADVSAKLAAAKARVDAEAAARAAQAACERRSIAAKLRAARRADHQLVQLNQFKQSMAAPDWDLEDLDWWGRDGAGRGGWQVGRQPARDGVCLAQEGGQPRLACGGQTTAQGGTQSCCGEKPPSSPAVTCGRHHDFAAGGPPTCQPCGSSHCAPKRRCPTRGAACWRATPRRWPTCRTQSRRCAPWRTCPACRCAGWGWGGGGVRCRGRMAG